jgi:hypothetical protein
MDIFFGALFMVYLLALLREPYSMSTRELDGRDG